MPIIEPPADRNPLLDAPRTRKAVYAALFVTALALAGVHVFLLTAGYDIPRWLVGVEAAYYVVAGGVGFLAKQNTPQTLAGQDAQREVDAIGGADGIPDDNPQRAAG